METLIGIVFVIVIMAVPIWYFLRQARLYQERIKRLRKALQHAKKLGMLGTNLCDTPFSFAVELRLGDGMRRIWVSPSVCLSRSDACSDA